MLSLRFIVHDASTLIPAQVDHISSAMLRAVFLREPPPLSRGCTFEERMRLVDPDFSTIQMILFFFAYA